MRPTADVLGVSGIPGMLLLPLSSRVGAGATAVRSTGAPSIRSAAANIHQD